MRIKYLAIDFRHSAYSHLYKQEILPSADGSLINPASSTSCSGLGFISLSCLLGVTERTGN